MMSWIWYILAFLWIFDAFRMRARIKSLVTLVPNAQEPTSGQFRIFTTAGVQIDGPTRTAALAYAAGQNLHLLDLVPGDTRTLQAIGLLQLVDPPTYRHNRVAVGYTSGFALVASEDVLTERARVSPAPVLSAVELPQLARNLRRFAGEQADLVIAPGLKATGDRLTTEWPVWAASVAGNAHALFMLRLIMNVVVIVGIVVSPQAGLVALAALHVQPLLTFLGTPLRPRDLWFASLLRTPLDLWGWALTFYSRLTAPDMRKVQLDSRRPHYAQMLSRGTAHFFEPRREDCPLCASGNLKVRVRNIDLIQGKPGVFKMEQCQACGHTFQNPRLSPEGLSFYYGDFYDGLGGQVAETMFRARPDLYEARARVVDGLIKPSRWLDVGTGQGHFCAAARRVWSEAEFDGLDISETIDDAVRAGWMNRGFHGFFPDKADDLKGAYDVVSMFHCLEHTPDLRRELKAVFTALSPGGLVVIENPNPECIFGKLFGRFWLPWFQPQHLHMPTTKNLRGVLEEQGFEVVRVQIGEAHLAIDCFAAIMLFYGWISPKLALPWQPRPRWYHHVRHFIVWVLGFPFIVMAFALDTLLGPLCKRVGISNAFRMVARRRETSGPERTLSAGVQVPVSAG
jgi:SAM-dependent methyltransferase